MQAGIQIQADRHDKSKSNQGIVLSHERTCKALQLPSKKQTDMNKENLNLRCSGEIHRVKQMRELATRSVVVSREEFSSKKAKDAENSSIQSVRLN